MRLTKEQKKIVFSYFGKYDTEIKDEGDLKFFMYHVEQGIGLKGFDKDLSIAESDLLYTFLVNTTKENDYNNKLIKLFRDLLSEKVVIK